MVPKSGAKVQAAIGRDVIFGEARAIHLGDDQPAVVGRDRNAVGKPQSVGDDSGRAVGHHQEDAADSPPISRRGQIEAEIADIGAAEAVDDHVINRAGRDF